MRGFGAITLGSPLPKFDSTALHDIVHIPFKIMEVLDEGCKYAIACGLLGMEKANLISRHTSPPWQLPVKLQARTGVVFASSYGQHSKAFEHIYAHAHRVATTEQIEYVRGVFHSHGYPAALLDEIVKSKCDKVTYERKISMELSLRANVQLAQIVKAMGPNTSCSNACASTTSAIKMACNELKVGDADRMIVISADKTIGSESTSSLVASFASLKAASVSSSAEATILPFSDKSTGFVFGEASVCIVLAAIPSGGQRSEDSLSPSLFPAAPRRKVVVLASKMGNAAATGVGLDATAIANLIKQCVFEGADCHPISFCRQCLYVSHDTFTQICADTEVEALLLALGDAAYELTITNSKKSTGHTMGVGVEDAIAVFSLQAGVAPSIDIGKVSDKYKKFKFSQGPVSTLRYALHLACGIGSHIAVVLYGIAD